MALGLVALTSPTLGIEAWERLTASLAQREAGVEHELLVVLNGFSDADPQPWLDLVAERPHRVVKIEPWVTDLAAYFEIVGREAHESFCFLNANSEVLVEGWLEKLASAAAEPGAGLVGATGTYESHRSNAWSSEQAAGTRFGRLRRLAAFAKVGRHFSRFPNPHLRTNAFLARRDLLLALDVPTLNDQLATHCFESGRDGLTKQVLDRGLRVEVVGANGRVYAPADWPVSETFRAGDQSNLLVADRRTREYEVAGVRARSELEKQSWGVRVAERAR